MRLLGFSLLATATMVAGIVGLQVMDSKADVGDMDMERTVVAELFTSQGCSSCPPADALAADLVKNDDIIVISRPVTYWDRLGWKDTLAKESNTDLQRAYAARGFARAGVYTPQIVINGRSAAIGSRSYAVRDLIMAEQKRKAQASLTSIAEDNGDIRVTLNGKTDATAHVTLLALDSSETVSVGRGENGGRTLTYTNVLVDEETIGKWRGGEKSFLIDANALNIAGADRYAVMVQQPRGGEILVASYIG
ncbi:MAG: DUF1223 domain-containing protein [Pseudomonadota bacterium]